MFNNMVALLVKIVILCGADSKAVITIAGPYDKSHNKIRVLYVKIRLLRKNVVQMSNDVPSNTSFLLSVKSSPR